MHQHRSGLICVFVFGFFLFSTLTILGQPEVKQVEPSYDLSLQLIIGSNEAGEKTDLPADLAGVTRQLKTRFTFAGYRSGGTFLGRVSNTGTFQYQSVANIGGGSLTADNPTFLDWSVSDLRNMPTSRGPVGFQAQGFRFGAKVPVVTSRRDENGKAIPSISYESVGLNISKIGVPDNVPTLVGTLSLPGTSGTVFLIMTVRSAE